MKRGASSGSLKNRDKKRSRAGSGEEEAHRSVLTDDTAVACGRCFNICATQGAPSLHVWGRNSVGQLGIGNKVGQLHPVEVPVEGGVSSVACGNFHSVALLEDGTALVWGSQARGRLGLGFAAHAPGALRHVPQVVPRDLFGGARVLAAACGLHHTAFLTEQGQLFTAGCNEFGQLGRSVAFRNTVGQPIPALVSLAGTLASADPVIVKISSGRHHMLALTRGGHMLSWGKGDVGQLGNGESLDHWEPQNIGGPLYLHRVRDFTAGRNHSIAVCYNNTVWSWGQAVDAQLGHNDRTDRMRPTEIIAFHGVPVLHVACTSRASHLITEDGRLFTWGFTIVPLCSPDYHPRDGNHIYWDYVMEPLDVTRECSFPPNLSPIRLFPGSTHVVLQMDSGLAFIWGDNPHGVGQQQPGEYPNWRNGVWPPVAMPREALPLLKMPRRDASDEHVDGLSMHLKVLLDDHFLSDVVLKNSVGREFPAHQFVVTARCPLLLDKVIMPSDDAVCDLIMRWVYTKRESGLVDLSARQLVQLETFLNQCSPYLGHLNEMTRGRFMMLVGSSAVEALSVAAIEPITAYQRDVVVGSLADHLAGKRLGVAELAHLSHSMISEVAVKSHDQIHVRPTLDKMEECSLASSFLQARNSVEGDFTIDFASGEQLKVHACILARMDFFNRMLHNPRMENSRSFTCSLPMQPMCALLDYIYGGQPEFSPSEALHLLSFEHGIRFFWASDPELDEELSALEEQLERSLENTAVEDLLDAFLSAQKLNIPLAESKLLSLLTLSYNDLKGQIAGLQPELLLDLQGKLLDQMQETIEVLQEDQVQDLDATLNGSFGPG